MIFRAILHITLTNMINYIFTIEKDGQDSQEDADACLSLMRWQVHEGVIKKIEKKMTLLKRRIRALDPALESLEKR